MHNISMRNIVQTKKSEKQVEKEILFYLNTLPGCFAWKNHSVGIYDPVKKVYRKSKNRHAINGVSDIVGIYKQRPLFIEVKAPGKEKTLSLEQEAFIQKAWLFGAIAFMATSFEQVKEKLESIK
jgi:hypothetical protein